VRDPRRPLSRNAGQLLSGYTCQVVMKAWTRPPRARHRRRSLSGVFGGLLDCDDSPMKALVPTLAFALVSCGADYAVEGTWERCCASGDHFGSYVMQLRRDGDAISGVVCRLSSGHRVFVDRLVSGRYPRMSFDASADNSGASRLDLRSVEDNLITGTDNNPYTSATYDFVRVPSGTYERCKSAAPWP
jgi:hypothetical protein